MLWAAHDYQDSTMSHYFWAFVFTILTKIMPWFIYFKNNNNNNVLILVYIVYYVMSNSYCLEQGGQKKISKTKELLGGRWRVKLPEPDTPGRFSLHLSTMRIKDIIIVFHFSFEQLSFCDIVKGFWLYYKVITREGAYKTTIKNYLYCKQNSTLSIWGTSLTDFNVSRNADITSSQQRKNDIYHF